ncbi:hypothetical protein DL96DRAFT_1640625 [Flagelloscypha sp. PMI_526]|nr:hypothetical protein DL96DRAFT_1640625 [Flagelloscypha sp. PMI_526]
MLSCFSLFMFISHVICILLFCVIGRLVLDDHDWKNRLPPQPPSSDGSDENISSDPDVIVSLLAIVIATPGSWLVFVLAIRLDGFLQGDWKIWGVLFRCFGLLGNGLAAAAAAGTALHLRYEYINAVSMMGIYGVGSVIVVGCLAAFILGFRMLILIMAPRCNED